MNEPFRLINYSLNDAFTNMAVDEAILASQEAGIALPTIRFYGWNPPAVSVGYFQHLKEELNPERLKSLGIEIARRPTGGRAVFHDKEITYSLSMTVNEKDGGITGTYKKIALAFMKGLSYLGIETKMAEKAEVLYEDSDCRKNSCFSTATRYELTAGGRKIIGSAQVRKKTAFLQHGSLLIDLDENKYKEIFEDELSLKRITTLRNEMGREPGKQEIINALKKGFEEEWGIKFVEEPLALSEITLVDFLKKTKYETSDWNLHEKKTGGDKNEDLFSQASGSRAFTAGKA